MEQDQKVVYNNINESPYYFDYYNFRFYFSSSFYRRNFANRVEAYVREEKYKLINRYKIVNSKFLDTLNEVLYISLYKKIEKRGFRILINNSVYKEN